MSLHICKHLFICIQKCKYLHIIISDVSVPSRSSVTSVPHPESDIEISAMNIPSVPRSHIENSTKSVPPEMSPSPVSRSYIESFTIHGWSKVFTGKSWEKIFWLLTFVGSPWRCLFQSAWFSQEISKQ